MHCAQEFFIELSRLAFSPYSDMLSKPQLLLGMIAVLAGGMGVAIAEETGLAADRGSNVEISRKADLGNTLTFDRETYLLRQNQSVPGASTSELREYLRPDETQEDYRKMISLRLQPVKKDDAMTAAQATLEQMLNTYPGSYVKEIEMTPEVATIMVVLVKNSDVEFNLWHFRKTKDGLPSVQFVLRNKHPYETQKKFKAEQKRNLDDWVRDIKAIGDQAEAFLGATKLGKVVYQDVRRIRTSPSSR